MTSVNTLATMGVPGLNGFRSPALHPVQSHKFRVIFYGFGDSTSEGVAPYVLTRQVQSVDLPRLQFSEKEINSYVSTLYIVGKGKWNPIDVTLLDDINGEVRSRVEKQVYAMQNYFDHTSARAGENYKFLMDIDILAGGATAGGAVDPNVLRRYCLSGCTLTSYNDNNMNYTNDDAKTISFTVRFDNCIVLDYNGSRMASDMSHEPQIIARIGDSVTGIGSNSVSLRAGVAAAATTAAAAAGNAATATTAAAG